MRPFTPTQAPHLAAPFSSAPFPAPNVSSLPYNELGGPGLERLCYLLLLADGHVPHYFGDAGQAQRGIDLLTTVGNERVVHQCKNVHKILPRDLTDIFALFESEWLGDTTLPRPDLFVLCCRPAIRNTSLSESWLKLEADLRRRTGVRGEIWDRGYLDERLKRLPDVVADLFGDATAASFCDTIEWRPDIFRPVRTGETVEPLRRFLDLEARGWLHVNPAREEEVSRTLAEHGEALLRGVPGSGKTTLGLWIARRLQGSSMRAFYVNLRYDVAESELVTGILARTTRPTAFFLDDCQGKLELVRNVRDRVFTTSAGRPSRCLLLYGRRFTPSPGEKDRGDPSDLESELEAAGAVVENSVDMNDFRAVMTLRKPSLRDATNAAVRRVFDLVGGDLLLLEHLLTCGSLETVGDIPRLEPLILFRTALRRYTGATSAHIPNVTRLACLAQFDIAPTAAVLEERLTGEDRRLVHSLAVTAGHPPRWVFFHSSAAEVLFRGLAWSDGRQDHAAYAIELILEYLLSSTLSPFAFAEDLRRLVRNELKLSHYDELLALKGALLIEPRLVARIEQTFDLVPLDLFALCVQAVRDAGHDVQAYLTVLQSKVTEGTLLRRLSSDHPASSWRMRQLGSQFTAELRRQFLMQTRSSAPETLPNLVALLAMLGEPGHAWVQFVQTLDDTYIDSVLQRSIVTRQSIGTLNLTLRELGSIGDGELLRSLEDKLGTERLLRLNRENGTIVELFRFLEYSSPSFSAALVNSLDDALLDVLVDKTVSAGRSVATLSFALRRLASIGDGQLLRSLESKLGTDRVLRLLRENGTVFELFRLLQYTSIAFSGALVTLLDDAILDVFIDKTITTGRSIGTLGLALREISFLDDGKVLRSLERKLGTERVRRLLRENGTIVELFAFLVHSSPEFSGDLLDALDDAFLDVLVNKTITTGRSIGTLGLALRELGSVRGGELLRSLEKRLGLDRVLRLLRENGTISELLQFMRYNSPDFADGLIHALDDVLLDVLVDRTVTTGRSIGMFHPASLGKRRKATLLSFVESMLGPDRLWRLVASNGHLGTLSDVLRPLTAAFQLAVGRISRIASPESLEGIIGRGDFGAVGYFAQQTPTSFIACWEGEFLRLLRSAFESCFEASSWAARNRGMKQLAVAPATELREALLLIARARIYQGPIAPADVSLLEAMNWLDLMWRERPGERDELARCWKGANDSIEGAIEDANLFTAARLYVGHMVDNRFSIEHARQAFCIGNDARLRLLFAETTTLEIFLHLWNLYALWSSRLRDHGSAFIDDLDPSLREAIASALLDRLDGNIDEREAQNLSQLAGLLSYLGIQAGGQARRHRLSPSTIAPTALRLTFVPAVFYLLGCEALGVVSAVLSDQWRIVLPKADLYETNTPTLDALKALVTRRIGQSGPAEALT